MKITGPKTRSAFDRYNIVSLTDLKEAAYKLSEVRQVERTDTSSGTFGDPAARKCGGGGRN